MTSDEARELFSDALEGALPAPTKAAFDAALAEDAELRDEWAAFQAVIGSTAQLAAKTEDTEPPADLLHGVQTRLRRRSKGRYYRDRFSEQAGPRSALPILVAILVALVLAASWVAIQSLVVIDPPRAAQGAD